MAGGRKKGGIALILLAVVLIVILGMVYAYTQIIAPMLNGGNGNGTTDPNQVVAPPVVEETVNIVIAAQAIPRGTKLTEALLTTIAYPKKEAPEGLFFTDMEQVLGKAALYNIEARVPITSSMIKDVGDQEWSASFDIPNSMTAVSIPMNRMNAVSYAIKPGDHIMIIGCMMLIDLDPDFQTALPNDVERKIVLAQEATGSTFSIVKGPKGRPETENYLDPTVSPVYILPHEDAQRPRLVCQNIIQDAVVLGLGDFGTTTAAAQPTEDPNAAPAPANEQSGPPPAPVMPDMITIIVSPQDAVLINYAMLANIKLNFALRSPIDAQTITTEAVTLQYLMDQKAIPLPVKLPYGIQPSIKELKFPTEQTTLPVTQP
jgi:pilus assembly protein CpaB